MGYNAVLEPSGHVDEFLRQHMKRGLRVCGSGPLKIYNSDLSIIEYGVYRFHLINPGRIIFGSLHRRAAVRAGDIWLVDAVATGRAFILVLTENIRMLDPACGFLAHNDSFPEMRLHTPSERPFCISLSASQVQTHISYIPLGPRLRFRRHNR